MEIWASHRKVTFSFSLCVGSHWSFKLSHFKNRLAHERKKCSPFFSEWIKELCYTAFHDFERQFFWFYKSIFSVVSSPNGTFFLSLLLLNKKPPMRNLEKCSTKTWFDVLYRKKRDHFVNYVCFSFLFSSTLFSWPNGNKFFCV